MKFLMGYFERKIDVEKREKRNEREKKGLPEIIVPDEIDKDGRCYWWDGRCEEERAYS